eukprot:gene62131-84971_t
MTDVYKHFFAAYGHYNIDAPYDYSNQLSNRRRNMRRRWFSFAYSCMTARELAVTTAVRCYGAVTQALASSSPSAPSRPSHTHHEGGAGSGTYFLSYEDLYAWYLFCGSEPFRELMIHAMDFFLERRQKGLRNKSVVSLLSNNKVVDRLEQAGLGLVLWPSLEEFVLRCQQKLNLSSPGSASYLHHLLLADLKPTL